jgi:3-dehydroquinate synthase
MSRSLSYQFGGFSCTVVPAHRDSLAATDRSERFVVADTNTVEILSGQADHVLPSGESSKSWDELKSILDRLLEVDLSRDGVVIGVGGGVVTDIAAFAASVYMRGVRLVLVPTTLLAMVDAAFGGKTGVNLGGYKNIVGTFYPAGELRICIDVLSSLSEREYLSGLAEALKTGMLGDTRVFEAIEKERDSVLARDPDLLEDIVWRCIQVKGSIVEKDLRESGIRAHLNLGHTFAHALEACQGLGEWSHGEAVAWGLIRAMELGEDLGITDSGYAERVGAVLHAYGYRTEPIPGSADLIVDAMRKDKKRMSEALRFVVQKKLGETSVIQVEPEQVRALLAGK